MVVAEVKLSEGQRRAIQQAANAPVMVLTGGPGCGKTFATATFVKLWRAMGRGANKVALCAPTGAHPSSYMSRCITGFTMFEYTVSSLSVNIVSDRQGSRPVVAWQQFTASLCCASGRAAERLASTARVQASTIHRLLMWVSAWAPLTSCLVVHYAMFYTAQFSRMTAQRPAVQGARQGAG
jgi:phage terminase large subunit-like protein